MTTKRMAARMTAYLAALAKTGNQSLSAERAKVSRSWVSQCRAQDPVFRARTDAAIAQARAALATAPGPRPGGRWRGHVGEELIVTTGPHGRSKIARARPGQWTPRVEARFLHALEQSCNVKAASAAVGLSKESAYSHRRRWSGFSARWDEALENGYDRLALSMAGAAGSMLGDPDCVPDLVVGPVSIGEALAALRLHRFRVTGHGRGLSARPRLRTVAELAPGILAKMDRVRRAERAAQASADRAARRRAARADQAAADRGADPEPVAPPPQANASPAKSPARRHPSR